MTIAACLKNQGYATGQFGKNHLGDLNHMLPTNHGFDEFFGNLYHLNAEEEPEMYDYFRRRTFRTSRVGPRGVIHSWATDTDDPTEEPRWGRVGKAEDRGYGTADKEADGNLRRRFRGKAAKEFIRRRRRGKPFFVWLNTTHMHLLHPYQAGEPGSGGALAIALSRHDDRPR